MYELIDFGEGRRLERFGDCLLDRPAAGTEGVPRSSESLADYSQALRDSSKPTNRRFRSAGDGFPTVRSLKLGSWNSGQFGLN